jgi:hypothetical protein
MSLSITDEIHVACLDLHICICYALLDQLTSMQDTTNESYCCLSNFTLQNRDPLSLLPIDLHIRPPSHFSERTE